MHTTDDTLTPTQAREYLHARTLEEADRLGKKLSRNHKHIPLHV